MQVVPAKTIITIGARFRCMWSPWMREGTHGIDESGIGEWRGEGIEL